MTEWEILSSLRIIIRNTHPVTLKQTNGVTLDNLTIKLS